MPRPKKVKPNRADGRYEVKLTIGHTMEGKPIRKSFYSEISREDARRKAEQFKVNQQVTLLTGCPGQSVGAPLSFAAWARQWLLAYKEGSVKDSTFDETYKRTVETYLIPYFGNAALTSIHQADIALFLNRQAEKYSDSTLQKMRLCLNAIFKAAQKNHLCPDNPAEGVKVSSKREKQPKRTLTEEQRQIVMDFCPSHPFGLYIAILLDAGLRCSELLGLRWGDIDLEEKTLSVRQASTAVHHTATLDKPKSASSMRTIPISTRLVQMLTAEKGDADDDSLIVCTQQGRPYTPANFTKNRYNLFWAALHEVHPEIPRLSPHELRHTCGSLLYARTRDIYAVSRYLGHANVQITAKIYIHASTDTLRANLGIE